jgi:hypothetical protein
MCPRCVEHRRRQAAAALSGTGNRDDDDDEVDTVDDEYDDSENSAFEEFYYHVTGIGSEFPDAFRRFVLRLGPEGTEEFIRLMARTEKNSELVDSPEYQREVMQFCKRRRVDLVELIKMATQLDATSEGDDESRVAHLDPAVSRRARMKELNKKKNKKRQ